MIQSRKIYLAGPEVFLPNSIEVLNSMKAICAKYNFIGMSPFDSEFNKSNTINQSSLEIAEQIFLNNRNLIQASDYIVANCNSFRGPLVDDGTSWEIGYAYGLGKTIFGYINSKKPLVENVINRIETKLHLSGHPIDMDGFLVNENFGNSINLMLEFSLSSSGGELAEGNFENCILKVLEFDRKMHP